MKLKILDPYEKTQLLAEFKEKTGIKFEKNNVLVNWMLKRINCNMMDSFSKSEFIAEFKAVTNTDIDEDDCYVLWALLNQFILDKKLVFYKKRIVPYIIVGAALLMLVGFGFGLISALKEKNSFYEHQLKLSPLLNKSQIYEDENQFVINIQTEGLKIDKNKNTLVLTIDK